MQTRNWTKIVCVTTLFALWPLTSGAATYVAFDSGDNSELLTDCPGDFAHRVLYSIDIGSLSSSDMLMVDYEAELTNPHSFAVEITSNVILAATATSGSGIELNEPESFNLVPSEYHAVLSRHSISQGKSGTNHFVNVVVSCQNVNGGSNGDATVEPDHGRLQILLIHN